MALMYRVDTVVAGLQGAPFFNQLYFLSSGGTPAQAHAGVVTMLQAAANQVSSNFTATVQGSVYSIESTTGGAVGTFPVTPVAVVGTSNGSPNPAATQGLLQLRTGTFVGGREVRGRMFLWGTVQTQNLNMAPTSGYITGWQTAANALATGTNPDWIVYSRTSKTYAAVASCTVWSKWAVLRSRRD